MICVEGLNDVGFLVALDVNDIDRSIVGIGECVLA